jgi:hypothetical protein
MYRCERCDAVIGPGVPAVATPIQTRRKEYPLRERANCHQRSRRLGKRRIRKVIWTDDPGGFGQETVEEILLCPDCAARGG